MRIRFTLDAIRLVVLAACCALVTVPTPAVGQPCPGPCFPDISPCGGNTFVNVDDVLATLDCVSGFIACNEDDCDVNCDGQIDLVDTTTARCVFIGGIGCCTPSPLGACCFSGGTRCSLADSGTCASVSGVYLGDGTTCATAACDCNGNTFGDDDDITFGTSQDCNANAVPDECDISECAPGNPACDDCNGNGIPDACDLAACLANPNCDDCNNNGIPDFCDIAGPTSADVDLNLTPDECTFWDGGGGDDLWFNALNWSGNIVPNNGVQQFHVVLEGASLNIFLNNHATVNTLRLLNGATLRVTGAAVGNLTVAIPNGIVNRGNLLVASNRSVSVPGSDVILGPQGSYEPLPAATSVSATLSARDVTVFEDLLDPGSIVLEQDMALETTGNLILDGSLALACDSLVIATGCRPPILRFTGGATLNVAGNITLLTSVDLRVQPTIASAADALAPRINLAGNLHNRTVYPQCFQWEQVTMVLDGVTSQLFEVAGDDLGPTTNGLIQNFALHTVEVVTGAQVKFVDRFNNQPPDEGPCSEALYVNRFVLRAGSTTTIEDCTVYYVTLIEELGASVALTGCGGLTPLNPAEIPTVSQWSLVLMFLLFLIAGTLVLGRLPATYQRTQLDIQRACRSGGTPSEPRPSGSGLAWKPGSGTSTTPSQDGGKRGAYGA